MSAICQLRTDTGVAFAQIPVSHCRRRERAKSTHSCPSRQALRTGAMRVNADFGGIRRFREAPRFVFGSSCCSSPNFSVSPPAPKSIASFTTLSTSSLLPHASDLRYSAIVAESPWLDFRAPGWAWAADKSRIWSPRTEEFLLGRPHPDTSAWVVLRIAQFGRDWKAHRSRAAKAVQKAAGLEEQPSAAHAF